MADTRTLPAWAVPGADIAVWFGGSFRGHARRATIQSVTPKTVTVTGVRYTWDDRLGHYRKGQDHIVTLDDPQAVAYFTRQDREIRMYDVDRAWREWKARPTDENREQVVDALDAARAMFADKTPADRG